MAEAGPAPEDSVDGKIRDVIDILQKLSCTRGSKMSEDFEVYHKKEADVQHKKEPGVPDVPKAIPYEGTSVDPPTPGALPTTDAKVQPLPIFVHDEADAKPEGGDAVQVMTEEMKDLKLDDPFQYNMHHNTRGLFVLFNVVNFAGNLETRTGSDVDAQLLETTFKNMKFEVKRMNDPKASDMVRVLKTVAEYDHSNMDCVAVAILTHGTWDPYIREARNDEVIADTIFASDRAMKFEDLTTPLRAKNCHKSLKGKPKLFFIQACRGEQLDKGARYLDINSGQQGSTVSHSGVESSDGESTKQTETEVGSATQAEDEGDYEESLPVRQTHSLPESMPIYKDFLVAWATAPGYMSFRNQDNGSIFIQTLCRYLDKFHATDDLLSILTWCNSEIAHTYKTDAPSTVRNPAKRNMHHKKQMPWYFSRLTKEVVFTPKPKPSPVA